MSDFSNLYRSFATFLVIQFTKSTFSSRQGFMRRLCIWNSKIYERERWGEGQRQR